jgi:carboxyl-terminal processing protease
VYEAQRGGVATEIPLVVLIDGGTASASEIVAGAIQDHGRGALVGETSFGKGSVQNWLPLDTDEGAVRVTIARWYTPNDRQIHGVGLEPDYPVAAAETPTTLEEDPQLAKAVEVLLAGVPLQ